MHRVYLWASLSLACLLFYGCNKPMPGSYTKTSINNESVIAAAEFAVSEESKKGKALTLVSVDTAETQVVAGMNYRVRLTVKDVGNSRKAEAVVYRNLDPNLNMSLTSWTWK